MAGNGGWLAEKHVPYQQNRVNKTGKDRIGGNAETGLLL